MPRGATLLFLSLFIIYRLSISAQTLPETSAKIRAALENKDYQMAIGELENLKNRDKRNFELNNYDYLLARAAEKNNDFAAAMANYQAVAGRNSILSEYALWHLSQIARAAGNLLLERIYLRQLLMLAPDALTNDAANLRLARSYFESKDFDTAIQMLEWQLRITNYELRDGADNPKSKIQNPNSDDRNPKTRENLALLGQAYLQSERTNEARDVFTRLINNLPNPAQPDDFALIAASALDRLDGGIENFGKRVPQLPEAEHLRRALIYQFNRNFPLARLHYQAIVERYPQSPKVADALYQTGRGFTQEANYNEAINWFERVLAEFPAASVARDALSQAASAYARVNKPKIAVTRYQTFIEKYADAENLERAYLNIVDVLRDQGEDTNALKWTAKTQEVFRGKLPEAVALFAQARIHISLNDWQNALVDLNNLQAFSDLGGARVPGGTNKAEVAFLKGFALENLNQFGDAIDVYLSIPDGRNEYYGWRATERLRLLANSEKGNQAALQKLNQLRYILSQPLSPANAESQRQTAQSAFRLTGDAQIQNLLLDAIKETYALLPNYRKIPSGKILDLGRKEVLRERRSPQTTNYHETLADELLFLGLYDEGAAELETSQTENGKWKTENEENNPKSTIQNPKSSDFAYTLAVFYKRGDEANRAVAYAEPLWKNVPADYQIELMPPEQIELLYPAPYAGALLKYAPDRGVDPRFMLSIMRQESRYRPDVKSFAAARGLLQFISTTADKLAVKLGRSNFNQDELYNPPTAILFGSQYLSDLFKIFPAQPQAVAASYNGGEDNMMRWLARANTPDADRYVPEIIFTQSKDYVYKVLANYRVYQMFYDEKLNNGKW